LYPFDYDVNALSLKKAGPLPDEALCYQDIVKIEGRDVTYDGDVRAGSVKMRQTRYTNELSVVRTASQSPSA
jgi:hypothetical protein